VIGLAIFNISIFTEILLSGLSGLVIAIASGTQVLSWRRSIVFGIAASILIGLCHRLHPGYVGLVLLGIWGLISIISGWINPTRDGSSRLSLWITLVSISATAALISTHSWTIGIGATGTIAVMMRFAPLWMERHRHYYSATLQCTKSKTIDRILEMAKRYQLELVSQHYAMTDSHELTLNYQTTPIVNHLFLRSVIADKGVKRVVRRDHAH